MVRSTGTWIREYARGARVGQVHPGYGFAESLDGAAEAAWLT